MNIKGLGPPQANTPETQDSQEKAALQAKEKQATGSPSKPGETVHLSSEALDIQKIEKSLAQLSEVDKERVEKLKLMIAEGSYTINSRNVADKLLGLDKDF